MENLKKILEKVNKEKGFKNAKQLAEYIIENTDEWNLPQCPHKPSGCKNQLWHEVLCFGLSANSASELIYD